MGIKTNIGIGIPEDKKPDAGRLFGISAGYYWAGTAYMLSAAVISLITGDMVWAKSGPFVLAVLVLLGRWAAGKEKDRAQVSRYYDCHRNDMVVAFTRVINRQLGEDGVKGLRESWFGRNPLATRAIHTAKGIVQAYIGEMSAPQLKGSIHMDPERNIISIVVPKAYRDRADRILDDVETELSKNSIYRGAALALSESVIEFMNLDDIDISRLTYGDKVMLDLKAQVWTLFDKLQECRDAGIKLQRKVLSSGTYGTGKTMAALWTAKKAVEHGWLFLYVQPTIKIPDQTNNLVSAALDFARKYPPCCVFIENLDHEQQVQDRHALERLMTAIDGALTKAGEFVIIMTTNDHAAISPGLKRPGRIDKVIDFGRFEPEDAVRLLKRVIPDGMRGDDINWQAIGDACEGYAAAFVEEVATASMLLAICEEGPSVVTQQMLMDSAGDLREQHKVCASGIGLHGPSVRKT